MVKISITGNTPLEALSSLAAFGLRCLSDSGVSQAASRILEAEKHEEKKLAAAQTQAAPASAQPQDGVTKPQQEAPVGETISDTPKAAQAPTEAPGPAGGESGPTPAPGDKRSPVPTVEQVRAKGIEASRKYGKEAVVAILQKFGASGMSAIAEKDRAAFLTELEGLGEGNA